MARLSHKAEAWESMGFLSRLRRDIAGNTLILLSAGLFPLLALVGGGIDMGRNYLAQTRLQQACDAGVLAARKQLGSQVVLGGSIPSDVATVGNKFFNINYRSGAYGTRDRAFQMTLEPDYAISGLASVKVPTTLMALFGYDKTDISVDCEAELSFGNTDVMFVLDTTGSMAWTNPGDSQPRIAVLRQTVKNFYAELQGNMPAGIRLRYGFLPYSSNVNVGGILKADWMVDSSNYEGRLPYQTGSNTTAAVFKEDWTYVSGTDEVEPERIETSCPGRTKTSNELRYWWDSDGTEHWEYLINGSEFTCTRISGGDFKVTERVYTNYRYIYSLLNKPATSTPIMTWRYQSIPVDVSPLKVGGALNVGGKISVKNMGGTPYNPAWYDSWFTGCIEERDTYEISDYSNVNFSQALDLDIDLVPSRNKPATQWRPILSELSYLRSYYPDGTGTFQPNPVNYDGEYATSQSYRTFACPAAARKLATMTAGEVSAYVDSLYPSGATYHDIGMIWGGRMLSPTGLFAAENADVGSVPTSRHMIFLTDGETAPTDFAYSSYGVEPLSRRRWSPGSSQTLTQVVEGRTSVACEEAKKRNITIWVIGFGTALNPVLTNCAGPGHFYEATNSTELQTIFSKIAAQLGNLRVSR